MNAVRDLMATGALVLVCSTTLMAQGRETLETKVTVRDGRVHLEWSAKHPWDATLLSSAPVLLAEYRTASGTVALDCLGSATSRYSGRGCAGLAGTRDRGPQERALTYTLPTGLSSAPRGAACLLFVMPDQRPLPLRRVDRERTETARFRYPEWEAAARLGVEREELATRVRELRAAVEARRMEIATAEQRNAERGWSSANACEAIPVPNLEAEGSSRPIAELREHAIVARQVCVMRVRNAEEQLARQPLVAKLSAGAVLPPSIIDSVLALLRRPKPAGPALSPDRQQQLNVFRRDYAQLAPNVAQYRTDVRQAGYSEPHFGTFDDFLSLQVYGRDAGRLVARAVTAGEEPRSDLLLGWVGGNLEAYSRCVDDGQAQLATATTAATELAARRPALEKSAREVLVKSCRDGVNRIDALRAQLGPLDRQLADAEQALARQRPPAALTDRAREVNQDACVP